jgi:hypothetical protein
MKYLRVLLGGLMGWIIAVQACGQCNLIHDKIDEFDSTRTVASKPINIGYIIPSNFETADGPKMVEEGKLMFSYSERDSIHAFFLIVAVQEREYLRVDNDYNVLLMLDDNQIIELVNFSDQGIFDSNTNMRLYQHTCVVPLDLFYALTHLKIAKIRINYRTYKHTIELSGPQQEGFRAAVRCVGEALKMLQIRP